MTPRSWRLGLCRAGLPTVLVGLLIQIASLSPRTKGAPQSASKRQEQLLRRDLSIRLALGMQTQLTFQIRAGESVSQGSKLG
jgi:hypothetical protein